MQLLASLALVQVHKPQKSFPLIRTLVKGMESSKNIFKRENKRNWIIDHLRGEKDKNFSMTHRSAE